MVKRGRFDSVRFFYMVVGHTKFQPDRLFASIAKTFYKRDVFCIEMLDAIAKQYSTSYIFKSDQVLVFNTVKLAILDHAQQHALNPSKLTDEK